MMKRVVCTWITIVSFSFLQSTAQPVITGIGKVTAVNIAGQKINITTENAVAEITVYSANIIRVRISRKKPSTDLSYAVVLEPVKTKAGIEQNENEITIITDSLQTKIKKNPFAVSFYTPDGKIINEDEKGLTTSWVGDEVTTYKKMQTGERFIGLGEKTGPLDRKGNGYTNWNTDAYGYSTNQDPIYSTIPFYIGIHDNLSYGIFFDNSFQSDFNFGASNNRFSSFGARGGEMNYYFIHHVALAGIITAYTSLTGRMHLPPLWSLGYQQNRYSYYPEAEVMRIAQTLREKKIPADGITLDIHYMDAYKLFTWNKERFPDPLNMTQALKKMGFKTTVIVDPGIKIEKGYAAYESGIKNDVFIKYPDSTYYSAEVWPGLCHFPDFTSVKGRQWWGSQIKTFAANGVDGLWNDMNEFATWGQKVPSNIVFDFEGRKATHLEARNVFALQMARASYDGARAALNKRPFVLSRAGYAGMQRYTAIWTGDNRSEDDHMLLGIRLLNSLGVSGVPFTGMDIGGFTGNPTSALFAKWIQIGAFNPYFRNHTGVNTQSSEPWTHGEEVTEISRNYISLRYKLLPYLYSSFYEATQDGLPIMRTLAIDYTHDPKVYDAQFQNQYFFGSAFLVTPFGSNINFGKIYLPAGKWYHLYDDEISAGNQEKIIPLSLQKLPVFVKGGSIIPMQSLVQSTSEKPSDTLLVHVYQGDSKNDFVYYEDDGETYNYESGAFYKRMISYDESKRSLVFSKAEGSYQSKSNYIKLVLHGFGNTGNCKLNGQTMELKDELFSFLIPVSRFDPQGRDNNQEGARVKTAVFRNDRDTISIGY